MATQAKELVTTEIKPGKGRLMKKLVTMELPKMSTEINVEQLGEQR